MSKNPPVNLIFKGRSVALPGSGQYGLCMMMRTGVDTLVLETQRARETDIIHVSLVAHG